MSDPITFIKDSSLFRSLLMGRTEIEIWPDEEVKLGGWAYFWIVSREPGIVKNLVYVRCKGGRIQKRTYDENGEDLWVDADG